MVVVLDAEEVMWIRRWLVVGGWWLWWHSWHLHDASRIRRIHTFNSVSTLYQHAGILLRFDWVAIRLDANVNNSTTDQQPNNSIRWTGGLTPNSLARCRIDTMKLAHQASSVAPSLGPTRSHPLVNIVDRHPGLDQQPRNLPGPPSGRNKS